MATPQFGWVPEPQMTPEQKVNHHLFLDEMPALQIMGEDKPPEKIALWKALAMVNATLAFILQSTGSCVGASAGYVKHLVQAVDIALRNQAEEFHPIWWLHSYGIGRWIAGFTKKGSGSYGSAQARADREFGTFRADESGLESYTARGMWMQIDDNVELKWSDGDDIPKQWVDLGKGHRLEVHVSPVKSPDDGVRTLATLSPLIMASMFGTKTIRRRGGSNPVNIAEPDGSWAHQMAVDGYWFHPELGLIFHVQNNWGDDAHPAPADDSPPGGFWITEKTFKGICDERYAEIYGYAGINGFKVPEVDHTLW